MQSFTKKVVIIVVVIFLVEVGNVGDDVCKRKYVDTHTVQTHILQQGFTNYGYNQY